MYTQIKLEIWNTGGVMIIIANNKCSTVEFQC